MNIKSAVIICLFAIGIYCFAFQVYEAISSVKEVNEVAQQYEFTVKTESRSLDQVSLQVSTEGILSLERRRFKSRKALGTGKGFACYVRG